jgi:hypothetical protein
MRSNASGDNARQPLMAKSRACSGKRSESGRHQGSVGGRSAVRYRQISNQSVPILVDSTTLESGREGDTFATKSETTLPAPWRRVALRRRLTPSIRRLFTDREHGKRRERTDLAPV